MNSSLIPLIICINFNIAEAGCQEVKRRISLGGGEEVEVLMVPWWPQHDLDKFCFPASLKMCLEYFKDYYSDAMRENLRNLSYEEIKKLCSSDPMNGTTISSSICERLTSELKHIKISVSLGWSLERLHDRFNKDLPTVAIYNGRYYRDNVRGPAHAGVYVGATKTGDPILNNPWYGSTTVFIKEKFIPAWELVKHRAVTFDPTVQVELR